MFIISWNVAGWSSTSAAIRESYGSLQHFFNLTGADIVCLQECKGSWTKLEADSVAMGASDLPLKKRKNVAPVAPLVGAGDDSTTAASPPNSVAAPNGLQSTSGIDGWESFWSFSGQNHRGFNGVVTFAKKGVTWRCDNAPFAEPEFNDEGRVVVTHHSCFIIVNVYVPNARGGHRLEFKFRFLESLKALIERLRKETRKPVILAGDMNMTYRPEDAAWTLRRIHLKELMHLYNKSLAYTGDEDGWRQRYPHMPLLTLKRLTNAITHALCRQLCELSLNPALCSDTPDPHGDNQSGSLSTVEGETSSPLASLRPASKATLPNAMSVVSVDTPPDQVKEGTFNSQKAHETLAKIRNAEAALGRMNAAAVGSGGVDYSDPPVPLEDLYACGFRSVFVDELTKNAQPSHNRDVFSLTRLCGLPPHGQESVRFMSSLLHETQWRSDADLATDRVMQFQRTTEKMWDTFRIGERDAGEGENTNYCPCPFTCWDQSRNKRLNNEGTRLDYILVDSVLAPFVVPRRNTPNNTGFTLTTSSLSPNSAFGDADSVENHVLVGSPASLGPGSSPDCVSDKADFFSSFSGAARTDSIRRAMAAGLYPTAPYDRSGLPPLQDSARGCVLCGLPSTGLFVSPPQFSDHIGVSVLFKSGDGCPELKSRPGKLVEDSGKCMYRPPVNLQFFFGASAMQQNKTMSTQNKQTPIQQQEKNTPAHKKTKVERDTQPTTETVDVDNDD